MPVIERTSAKLVVRYYDRAGVHYRSAIYTGIDAIVLVVEKQDYEPDVRVKG